MIVMIARSVCINFSVHRLLLKASKFLLLIAIALFVKVGEEKEKHHSMKTNPNHEALWIIAISPK